MKENSINNERSSIREAIKTMEHWVEYEKNNKDKINKADELIYIQEAVLSGYKRILKENELLRKDIEGWKKYCEEIEEEQTKMSNKNCELEFEIEKLQKENEELKQDRNNNYKMIALAQNEALGYMQGYEDGKKLKKSALTYIEENQQYYIIKKKFEQYEERIEKLLKENEELKSVKKECVFREDGTEECLWHCSNCNKEWLFYEGTPEDNELKYCPHCGSKVTKYENYIEGEIEVANKMEENLIEKLQKENEELKADNYELNNRINDLLDKSNERYQHTQNEISQPLKLSQTPPPEPQLPTKTICESFSKKRK